jgi:hypothetical protein
MPQPPLLPEETFARVARTARLDGMCVLLIAGSLALVSAIGGDFFSAVIGLLIAGAGAIELHGVGLLREGEPRGVNWLVGSQIYLLASILFYCTLRLIHFEMPPIPDELRPLIDTTAADLDMTTDQYIRLVYRVALWLFAILSFFYQGAMITYYARRRAAVVRALDHA